MIRLSILWHFSFYRFLFSFAFFSILFHSFLVTSQHFIWTRILCWNIVQCCIFFLNYFSLLIPRDRCIYKWDQRDKNDFSFSNFHMYILYLYIEKNVIKHKFSNYEIREKAITIIIIIQLKFYWNNIGVLVLLFLYCNVT